MFVSIITITYNAESLIDRTLQSVLSQTCTDYEYVVIDGNSTDKTLEHLKKYEDLFRDKKIEFHWTSEPDKGIYDAMNKGLKRAKGDFIWFVNGGDVIANKKVLEDIQKQLVKMDLPDFIYGETLIVDAEGKVLGERRLKAPEKLSWKSFRMGMLVCHQSMLVKRVLAPPFNTDYLYSSDYDWSIRCLKKSKVRWNTHIVLSHFLDGGVSKKKMRASLKERFMIMSSNYGWLPTTLRHFWFVLRAVAFKLTHGWF